MSAEWIKHENTKILLIDLTNSNEEEQLETLDVGNKILREEPSNSVLIMLDTTDRETTVNVNFKLNDHKSVIKEKTKAVSVVGAKGIQNWIASIFMSGIYCVKTREEAMEWLIKQ